MLKKKYNTYNILISFVIVLLAGGCKRDPLKIDVSDIEINIEVNRFEQDFFSLKPEITGSEINRLSDQYPVFFDLFTRYMLRITDDDPTTMQSVLNDFASDPDIETVYNYVTSRYSTIDKITSEIENGFKHHKYYFPQSVTPSIVTFVSGLQYAVITSDSLVGIGLDMYLGDNYVFYEALGLPKFKTAKMTEDYIVVDVFRGWAQSEYEQDQVQRDMLSQIIYHGKILHFIEAMRPREEKHKIIGYTKEQMEWCRDNEANIWSFFISQNLLYSTEQVKIAKFINEGPGTGGFPAEAPSMLGNYIGWQIVKEFREKNKEVTLAELMEINDAQRILNQSGYKPKK